MAVNKNFVVKNGLEVSTDLIFADASTEKVGIGSTIPATQLDVLGGIGASELNVTGVGTIVTLNGTTGIVTTVVGHNVQAGNLNITGITTIPRLGTLSELVVSGVSTFNDDIDANADVAISGITTIGGNLGVTGVSTFNTFVSIGGSIFVSGISTFSGTIDANGNLDVDGYTELDDLNVSGVSTFAGTIDANGDLDVDGQTDLDVLNVAETATFSGTIDANGNLDVDGYTELDDLNVSGVSTFAGAIDVNGISTFSNDITLKGSQAGVTSVFWDASADTLTFQDLSYANFGAGSDLSIFHNGSHSYIKDAGTGELIIESAAGGVRFNSASNATGLLFNPNTSIDLFYNDTKRFETASDDAGGGVIVTGKIVGTAATIGTGVTINNTGIDLGIGGVGIVTANNITGTSATIANVLFTKDASGIGATVGAAVGIVTYIGDGSQLIGLGIGIGGTGTNGLGEDGLVGYGFTQVNFIGSGVSEVSYNTSVGIATIWIAGGGGGTASAATEITVTDESSDTTCFPIFAVSATGDIEPKTGSNITFNSSSGALTATSFVGDVTGDVTGNCTGSSGSCTGNAATSSSCTGNAATATLATEATNVTATANNSTDETVYPTFVDGTTGTQGIETDSGLTYNPSTGVLTSTTFTGALTGNVTGNCTGSSGSCTGNAATSSSCTGNAASADTVDTTATSTDATYYLTFVDSNNSTATAETVNTDANLQYNPSTDTLTTTSFSGTLSGNVSGNCTGSSGSCTGNAATADKVDTTATSTDATYYLTFVDANNSTATAETVNTCLLYTSPSPRDRTRSRMPSSA